MPGITAKPFEPVDATIRRFKRQCEKAGVLSEVRRREAYEKPSVRKRQKSEAARRKAMKRASRYFAK